MKLGLLCSSLLMLICALGVSGTGSKMRPLFATSDRCMACHNGIVTDDGEDVSIGIDWRPSMMANSSRDPYWQAAVRREAMDHPPAGEAIENECAICHMPMAGFEHRIAGRRIRIFDTLAPTLAPTHTGALAVDGVSCTACHQITNEGMGLKESFTGHFGMDPQTSIGNRRIFGPYEIDTGRATVMRSSSGFVPEQAAHVRASELCATCHTLYTHALDENGNTIAQLPEQVPYLEWRHSGYRNSRSCQSCHMPRLENINISSVLGQPREILARHVFRAGNFFMPRIFARYRDQLNVAALTTELNRASEQTVDHLQNSSARLSISQVEILPEKLVAEVSIRNLAGHKLPTAYPSRRAWIHLTVKNREGGIVFESGSFRPDGSILGNDNDADAARYEPHYSEIDSADKVQVYESIMADAAGRITTGLLKGVRFIKDNRILPLGFDKTKADQDIAVQGAASDDGNFAAGGDRVRYTIKLKPDRGPYRIEANLWYQPIAYRWAQNLKTRKAAETDRFVSYYESMPQASAIVLATAAIETR